MMGYVKDFKKLLCSQDVLDVLKPISNKDKEISEAMAVIKRVKRIIFKNKNTRYNLIDLCSGNSLIPVLGAFLLPIEKAFAIDRREQRRDFSSVIKFQYIQKDILKSDISVLSGPSIITSCHPCKKLSVRVIDLFFSNHLVEHLVIMPCCVDNSSAIPYLINQKLGKEFGWVLHLFSYLNYRLNVFENLNVKMYQDEKCLSPRNILIVASKTEKKRAEDRLK